MMHRRRRVICSALLLFLSSVMFAEKTEKRSMSIRWSGVPGASGYAVEWTGSDGRVVQQKSATSVVELSLEAGEYCIRVSALNRFGKPAGWSDWKTFRVEDAAQKQSLDLNRPEEPAKKEPVSQTTAPPLWKRSVPGWVQIERQQWRGWAYPSALGLLAVYAWDQKRRGDLIASDALNDPDLIMPLSISSYAALGNALWIRRSQQRELYDAHQRNQRLAGMAAIGVVALHWIDISFFEDDRSAVIVQDGTISFRMRF